MKKKKKNSSVITDLKFSKVIKPCKTIYSMTCSICIVQGLCVIACVHLPVTVPRIPCCTSSRSCILNRKWTFLLMAVLATSGKYLLHLQIASLYLHTNFT